MTLNGKNEVFSFTYVTYRKRKVLFQLYYYYMNLNDKNWGEFWCVMFVGDLVETDPSRINLSSFCDICHGVCSFFYIAESDYVTPYDVLQLSETLISGRTRIFFLMYQKIRDSCRVCLERTGT